MPIPKNDQWRIRPAIGNVLVKPLAEEERTASGLYLVTEIEKETHIAEVVELCEPYESAADDRSWVRSGPIYSIGDLVIIGKYNGRDIKIRERSDRPHVKYIIIRESDVLGKLELRGSNEGDNREGMGDGAGSTRTAEGDLGGYDIGTTGRASPA